MSFEAKTIRTTQLVSVRFPPKSVAKGRKIEVWDEQQGWGLVDVLIEGKLETGEMKSDDYRRVP